MPEIGEKSICVVGSIVYDHVMQLPHLPEKGETVLGDSFSTFIGGKGLNQAMQIFRLAHPLNFFGRIGDDRFGLEVLECLRSQDFPVDGIFVGPGEQTAAGMIFVAPDGTNKIGGVPAANMNFSPDEITDKMIRAVQEASILSLQLEIPLGVNRRLLTIATDSDVPAVLNAAPYRALPDEIIELVEYWVVNEIEAGQFFGCRITGIDDCVPVYDYDPVADGRQTWIITLGAGGAVVVDKDGMTRIPGMQVRAVDSTGAGDSFTGGFVVGLAEGMNAVEAADFANRTAAVSVTKLGGMTGLPFRSEVMAVSDTF